MLMFKTAYSISVSKYLFVYIFIYSLTQIIEGETVSKNASKLFTYFHGDGKAKHHGSVSPYRGISPFLVAMAVVQ